MRYRLSAIALILFFIFPGCKDDAWLDLFTFKSVRSAKGESIEELEKEAEEYKKVINQKIEAGGKLGLIYQKIGEKYLDRKAWDAAIIAFEKAVGYGSGNSIVYYSLGAAHANRAKDFGIKSDMEKAEGYYRKALGIEPDFHDASYGLAVLLYYVKGDRQEGADVMERLVLKAKNYYPARFAMARIHYESGNPQKALIMYENLYADLDKLAGSPGIEEYKNTCRENIERLMKELAEKK